MRCLHAAALLAATFVTTLSAAAQMSVDGRIAFRNDHAPSTTPTGNDYTIGATGTYDFQALFGVFDAVGFTNRGIFNHIGQLQLADLTGTTTIAPRAGGARRYPYTFGPPATDGVAGNPILFDFNRGLGSIVVPWPEGEPMPGQPIYSSFDPAVLGSGGAPDEYFPGYRFTVNINNLTPRTITITASGQMQAITTFSPHQIDPPDGAPGSVTYFPTGYVMDLDNVAILRLHIIPGPGTLASALLGGLLLGRRRRDSSTPAGKAPANFRRGQGAAAALLVSVATAPVLAQPFQPQADFRNDHAADVVPTGNVYTIHAPGAYNFTALFGAFGGTDATNRGLWSYDASLVLADPLSEATIAPRTGGARRAPYADTTLDGTSGNPILFRAARSTTPLVVPWPEGQPMPGQPFYPSYQPGVPESGGAPNEYFPGYRFVFTVGDLTPRTVTVTLGGTMFAVASFAPFNIVPPNGGPGVVEYFANTFTTVAGDHAVLTLHIIPAPAAAILLLAGPTLAAARRRR